MRVWSRKFITFHWLLVIVLVTGFFSIKLGFDDLHFLIGYALTLPLMIRIYLLTKGNKYEKLSSFFNILNIKEYLKTKKPYTGHNPLASLVMLLMIIDLITLFISGLFAQSFIEFSGFFVDLSLSISNETALLIKAIHKLSFIFFLGLIALHLLGLILSFKTYGTTDIKSIFTGRKDEK